MNKLPKTAASPLLRTDFSNAAAWKTICDEIQTPSPEGFKANVAFIDDKAFENITAQQILEAVPEGYPHSFVIVADRASMDSTNRTLLIVNLEGEGAGQNFRCIISEMWAVENNLSLANMGFEEFASAVDSNGVHRGF